jgi:hypothetical protein
MCNFLLSSVPLCKTQALMSFSIPAKKSNFLLNLYLDEKQGVCGSQNFALQFCCVNLK